MSSLDPIDTRIAALVRRPSLLRSLERFLHVEAASGVVLLIAAVVALAWANSPWAAVYDGLWHLPIGVRIGEWHAAASLHFVINDMLMAIFFLVVGLEIRREISEGTLSDLRAGALPVIAAIGGVIAPALIYTALNSGSDAQHGWAIPTATDIAFAVGVLALLGKRVPASLRILLLALAIIDDIIAILIIALFYSSGVQWHGFAIAALGIALVFVCRTVGLRSAWAYVAPGAIVWFGMWQAQIHPAIAGVVLGLLTPVARVAHREHLADVADDAVARFRESEHRQAKPVQHLASIQREMLSPAERVQTALHPWVAFGIMPLFALANSGVSLAGVSPASLVGHSISLGVILGLCLGKPLGITLASYLAVKLRIAALPPGSTLRGVLLVGCLGGIGFTMAIFIANLAFASPEWLSEAKLAILVGSTLSGVIGLAAGRLLLPRSTHTE